MGAHLYSSSPLQELAPVVPVFSLTISSTLYCVHYDPRSSLFMGTKTKLKFKTNNMRTISDTPGWEKLETVDARMIQGAQLVGYLLVA